MFRQIKKQIGLIWYLRVFNFFIKKYKATWESEGFYPAKTLAEK